MGEINKTTNIQVTATKPLTVKWIVADTEPAAPTGYERMPEFDIAFGDLGTLWAFKETA